MGDSLLSWRISTLPAGSERVILLKVKPTKAGGALDHAATVTFQAGSKATSRVLRPRLKLEVVQTPAEGKVLKNKTAEFRIAVTNTGDGPARNVTVQAKLSPGLAPRDRRAERGQQLRAADPGARARPARGARPADRRRHPGGRAVVPDHGQQHRRRSSTRRRPRSSGDSRSSSPSSR